MSNDASQRLDELKLLWESDPSSKVYLQLASVYRQKGQLDKAVEVLETSLQHRPRDPRGRVALARCKMDLVNPQAAAELLEEVIRQDAAHLEANKQLLECYLQIGDGKKAEERLNIYRLLNDRDPELDHLEYRLSSLQDGGEEHDPASTESSEGARSVPERAVPVQAVPERAVPVQAVPEQPTPVTPAPEPAAPEPAAAEREPVEAAASPEPEQPAIETPEVAAVESETPERARKASSDDGGEDELFELPPTPQAAGEDPWGGDLFDLEGPKVEAAAPDLGGLWEQTEVVDLEEDEIEEPSGDSVPSAADDGVDRDSAGPATATLGLLYLKQGHLDEAETILRKVLERDSENEAALAGLQQLETERAAAAADESEPDGPAGSIATPEVATPEIGAPEIEAPVSDEPEKGETAHPEVVAEEPAVTFDPATPATAEPEIAQGTSSESGSAPPDASEEVESVTADEAPSDQAPDGSQPSDEPAQSDEKASTPALTAQALLGRVALEGGMPADATGRKIAVLQKYIQQIRTASGTHVH